MNPDKDTSSPLQLATNESPATTAQQQLDRIVAQIHEIADRDRTDPLALLQLLRTLEQIHREIQEGYFQSALQIGRAHV